MSITYLRYATLIHLLTSNTRLSLPPPLPPSFSLPSFPPLPYFTNTAPPHTFPTNYQILRAVCCWCMAMLQPENLPKDQPERYHGFSSRALMDCCKQKRGTDPACWTPSVAEEYGRLLKVMKKAPPPPSSVEAEAAAARQRQAREQRETEEQERARWEAQQVARVAREEAEWRRREKVEARAERDFYDESVRRLERVGRRREGREAGERRRREGREAGEGRRRWNVGVPIVLGLAPPLIPIPLRHIPYGVQGGDMPPPPPALLPRYSLEEGVDIPPPPPPLLPRYSLEEGVDIPPPPPPRQPSLVLRGSNGEAEERKRRVDGMRSRGPPPPCGGIPPPPPPTHETPVRSPPQSNSLGLCIVHCRVRHKHTFKRYDAAMEAMEARLNGLVADPRFISNALMADPQLHALKSGSLRVLSYVVCAWRTWPYGGLSSIVPC